MSQYVRYPAGGPSLPLSIANGGTGLSSGGSANQVLGMDNSGLALEYKTVAGTANQVSVANAANLITLSLPQSIATSSSPTFSSLTLSGTLTMSAASGANHLWTTDASGNIGDSAGLHRPNNIYVKNVIDIGVAYATSGPALSTSSDGTNGLILGSAGGTAHALRWDNGTQLWGFKSDPASDTMRVYFNTSDNGNIIQFRDNGASGRIVMFGSSADVIANTDGGATLGLQDANRFNKAYIKNAVYVGAYPGSGVSNTLSCYNQAITAGVLLGETSTSSDMRLIWTDGITGNYGFHSDPVTNYDQLDYKNSAGTVLFRIAKTSGKVLVTNGLGVGNSAAATTPGTVTKKIEIFDASGVSLGFIAVYDAIT